MTLTEFLLARIEDRERLADEVHIDDCSCLLRPTPFPCDCGEPARVLAECEAKRQIVAMQAENDDVRHEPGFHYKAQMIEGILRTLALPYADHPDYNARWRSPA